MMEFDKVTKRRIITIAIIAGLLVLSILTTAIPPLTPIMADADKAVTAFNADPENLSLNKGDIAWMLTSSALVLIMTPGLAFFYGGMVRDKNVISTLLQSYVAMGLVSVLWVVIGFSLAFGDSLGGFIGNPATYFFFNNVGAAPNSSISANIPLSLYAVFQLKFAVITPALISGALAERVRFTSYVIFITLFSIFIYSPLAHMVWHPDGLLHKAGILDFAGGTVVHMSSGYSALIASWMLGKRHHAPQKVAPASIPFVMLGTALLWFGWFGFNAGSALAANPLAVQAFLTTNTAAAMAMLTWIFVDHIRGSKSTAMGACVGAVVGLVAITPAAGFVTVGGSMCIGMVGALVSNLVAHVFNEKSNVDDTLDVWPCHGLGGTTGMVLTSMFATKSVNPLGNDGLFYGNATLFWHHLVALACVVPFICVLAFILCKVTNLIYPMRVSDKSERLGLDMTQHNETMKHFDEVDLEAESKANVYKVVGDIEMSRPGMEA